MFIFFLIVEYLASALRKTAAMKLNNVPEASQVILNSSCMDDIIDCTDTIKYTKTTNINILKGANLHVKDCVFSPENVRNVRAVMLDGIYLMGHLVSLAKAKSHPLK